MSLEENRHAPPPGDPVPEERKATRYEHWSEWFSLCAVDLCSKETKDALGGLARKRLLKFLECYAWQLRSPDAEVAAVEFYRAVKVDRLFGWREVETRYWHTAEGAELDSLHFVPEAEKKRKKRIERRAWIIREYKEELGRDGAAEARNFLEAKVTHWVKDIVRKAVRDLKIPMVSIETADGGDPEQGKSHKGNRDSSGPDASCFDRDLAAEIFERLGERERIVLLASLCGLSLDHPVVREAAGCGKSQVYASLRIANESARSFIAWEGIPRSEVGAGFAGHLLDRLFSWAKSEERLARLLLEIH